MAPQPEKTDLQAILQTPEAQKLIAEAAAKAVGEIARAQGNALNGESAESVLSKMALAIAEISHQGSGRVRPVAPEVMAQRQEASRKLHALLAEVGSHVKRAKDNDDTEAMKKWMPRYQVVAKIFFNEQFIEPFTRAPRPGDPPIPSIITWSGPPNDALVPLNDIAKRLKQLFKESVGTAAKLEPISGPNGGQVAPDRRQYWMTFEGRVVQGSAPPRARVLDALSDDPDYKPQNDPTAPFVNILGTVHPATPQKAGDVATLAAGAR